MAQSRNFHEDMIRDEHVHIPTDKIFGLTLGSVFLTLGFLKLLVFGWLLSYVFIAAGSAFLGLAFYKPDLLHPIKIKFLKIAPVISRTLNPVIMGFIYVLCFIPGGLIMKMLRHDPLHRDFDPYVSSYWVKREHHDIPDPMKYQF